MIEAWNKLKFEIHENEPYRTVYLDRVIYSLFIRCCISSKYSTGVKILLKF